ncbi:hypothetical protein QL996_15565 [Planococcus sp. APC 4015]|nr:hypothetical protein [Planococcus sp. APC 4015]
MNIDAQLASDILVGVIALMSAVGGVALVGAIFSLGRSGYRKD